ncbi:MAG TPA: PAS domain-containing protein [bacterium]|nr:PAS domain-containing protein [bacterium]
MYIEQSSKIETNVQGEMGHWLMIPEQNIASWSKEIFDIFGLEQENPQISSQIYQQYLNSSDWKKLQNAIEMSIEKGNSFQIDARITYPRKNSRWIRITGSPINNQKKKHIKIIGTIQKINNHQVRKHAQSNKMLKYRKILENLHQAIAVIQGHKLIYANNAFAEIIKEDQSDILFEDSNKFFSPNVISKMIKFLNNEHKELLRIKTFKGTLINSKSHEIPVDIKCKATQLQEMSALLASITKILDNNAGTQTIKKGKKELENFVHICASCNKIREQEKDEKPWVSPAVYFRERIPDMKFSHGLCPECRDKSMQEYLEFRNKNGDE